MQDFEKSKNQKQRKMRISLKLILIEIIAKPKYGKCGLSQIEVYNAELIPKRMS